MSQLLQTIHASAPSSDLKLHTLELSNAEFPNGRFLLAQAYQDYTCGLETGETVTFKKSGFGLVEPKRSITGNLSLQFQLDNISGEELFYLKKVINAGTKVPVIYRPYLISNLTAPAEAPVKLTATSFVGDYYSLNVVADLHDFINKAWPNKRYTTQDYPGLKYI